MEPAIIWLIVIIIVIIIAIAIAIGGVRVGPAVPYHQQPYYDPYGYHPPPPPRHDDHPILHGISHLFSGPPRHHGR